MRVVRPGSELVDTEYKAVLFDLDDTLLDFHACETNALKHAFALADFEVDAASSWARIWNTYEPISSRYWSRRARDGLSRNQVVEYSIRDALMALTEPELLASTIAQEYWVIFCTTAHLNSGANEILEKLFGRYKLGLVTNGYSQAQRGRLQAAGLRHFFASVVISDDVGCAKPDRRIFEIALSELGVTSQDALYVGDSIEHDYRGATNAGMDFCHYQHRKPKGDEGIDCRFRISDLDQLGQFLLRSKSIR